MSFILDALRKSELERQRDSAPDLMRSPVATIRRETPAWSWLLIVLLSLALTAVAAAWWLRNSDAEVAVTAGQAVTSAVPAAAAEASTPAAGSVPSVSPDAEAAVTGADTGTVASAGEPRPMADLIRGYPNLPRYVLSFLEYRGADPDRGSAWINGRRYYPGQVVEGGPELVGIQPDGALLAYRGQTYLLTAR